MAYEGITELVSVIRREQDEAAAAWESQVGLSERRAELSGQLFAAHHRAVYLVVSLLDRYGAPEPILVPGDDYIDPYYYRKTDPINLGELYSDDVEGLTHGFAVVSAIYRAQKLTRKRKSFPIFGAEIPEIVGSKPTAEITRVNVGLQKGTPDGGITQSLADLTTASSFSSSSDLEKAVPELTELLGQCGHAVLALEILAEGGTSLPRA